MQVKTFLREMGDRISARRRQLHITQAELAERMDVSVQMISYAETGRNAIRPENLARLCEVLQISADYILLGHSSPVEAGRLVQKLEVLSADELAAVESIIDSCLLLAGREES